MSPDDLNELRRRAAAGEPRAQYVLAATLARAGAREEAERWLQSAATLGEPDAGYTLATRHLQTRAGATKAASLLEQAVEGGSLAAARLLSVLYAEGFGVELYWPRAVGLIADAAQAGDPAARRAVAMLLLSRDQGDRAGAALLADAAEKDAVAGAVLARRAVDGHGEEARARALVGKLAAAGYPNAGALEAGLAAVGTGTAPSRETGALDWNAIVSVLTADAPEAPVEAPAEADVLCDAPAARVFRGAFSPAACEYVIAVAAQRLAPSHTFDPVTGATRRDAYRTSMTAVLGPVDLDLALVAVNRRLAALAGRPHENGEFLSVLRYAPGQEYRPHFDWLPPGEDFDRGGQRAATALLYLNEDYEGGETCFLTPDIRFKGAAGDVLVFENVLPDGAPDKASRHAGAPVAKGAKWIGSKWFREKKYNF